MKWLIFTLLALPAVWLGYAVYGEALQPGSVLGADPAAALVDYLGQWSIRMLLIALAITPLRKLTGWTWLARSRRMAGLFAFSYLGLHACAYVVLLAGLDPMVLLQDLTERPYIIVGSLALVLLVPLAVTSTRGWQRRLRGSWVKLHKLVFPAVGLGLLHLFWLTKDGYAELVVYVALFSLLLAARWYFAQPRSLAGRAMTSGSG